MPKPSQRGAITTKDLSNAITTDGCVRLFRNCAEEIYRAWRARHAVVSEIAEAFLGIGNLDEIVVFVLVQSPFNEACFTKLKPNTCLLLHFSVHHG